MATVAGAPEFPQVACRTSSCKSSTLDVIYHKIKSVAMINKIAVLTDCREMLLKQSHVDHQEPDEVRNQKSSGSLFALQREL
jgi:hypothetical protein